MRNDLQMSALLGNAAQNSTFVNSDGVAQNMLNFGATGKTFSAILSTLSEFGTVRTLSSPRLTVMNNQTAILKVAQNQVYFRLNYDKEYSTSVNRESINVSSDIQTVPIGLVMSVQPSIDYKTGRIILFLRPTISRLSRSVADPAVDIVYNSTLTNNNIGSNQLVAAKPSLIPIVEVREIDSVLHLNNQELAILGGLMEVRSSSDNVKIPIVGDVPVIGELFSAQANGDQVVELVILLKATIINSEHTLAPDAADRRLFNDYIQDPRNAM